MSAFLYSFIVVNIVILTSIIYTEKNIIKWKIV